MGTVRVAVSANGSGDDANGEDHLFKTVGRQVEGLSLDGVETTHDDSTGVEVVDKIESLCMNCHEDVRYTQAAKDSNAAKCSSTGRNEASPHQGSLLPRNHPHVIRMRTLWLQKYRNTVRW